MEVGLKPTIRSMYAEGDTVIVFDASGTARDGKIVKAFAFFDSVVFNDFWDRLKP
jgi:hypothetical protein